MSLSDRAPSHPDLSSQSLAPTPLSESHTASTGLSSMAGKDENQQQLSAVGSNSTDDKREKKHHGLFGLRKKKGENDVAASSTTPQTVTTNAAVDPTSILSKSLPPPPPPPKSNARNLVAEIAPQPPAKDLPGRKPSSPHSADRVSPLSTSITSSGAGERFTTGSTNGPHYVQPPSSPGRSVAALPSSPPMSSPAGSQIFERDVQESNSALMPGSPAIPSHITTENFIPPVLDASSEAITDGLLDPNSVEIITHTHHQPAAVAMAGMAGSGGVNSSAASGTLAWGDELASSFNTEKDDSASNYGSLDTTDIRRLSFISFADVVQAEQQQQQHQHQQSVAGPSSLVGLANLATSGATVQRSPSPIRSPARKSVSVKTLELSPQRSSRALGSPTRSPNILATGTQVSQVGGSGSEISVETMSQALRRTCSSDFGVVRSTPQSPA